MSDVMDPLSVSQSYVISYHWKFLYRPLTIIGHGPGHHYQLVRLLSPIKPNILHFHCKNSLHDGWFISSAAPDSLMTVSLHVIIATTTTSTFFNLHATPCNILFNHNRKAWCKMASEFSLHENVPKLHNVAKARLFLIVFNFHHLFKGSVSLLYYNVVFALCWKLQAIYVSLNLIACIKHRYWIELTLLFCQLQFKFSQPSDALIVITKRKGKLLWHSIKKTLCVGFCFVSV